MPLYLQVSKSLLYKPKQQNASQKSAFFVFFAVSKLPEPKSRTGISRMLTLTAAG